MQLSRRRFVSFGLAVAVPAALGAPSALWAKGGGKKGGTPKGVKSTFNKNAKSAIKPKFNSASQVGKRGQVTPKFNSAASGSGGSGSGKPLGAGRSGGPTPPRP